MHANPAEAADGGACAYVTWAAVACRRYKWRWAKDSQGRRSLLSAAVNALDKQLGPEKVQVRRRAASILKGVKSSSARC